VTTPDTTKDALMIPESLDAALRDLLSFEPRADLLRRLDERVTAATATFPSASARASRRLRLRRGRRVVAILAAALLLVGASGALGLYEGMGTGFDVGFGLQLDRSVAVGATDVHDGYRVTIDRAYLDPERLMLAIRVTDELERPQVRQLMAMGAVVTDADGVWAGVGGATSRPIGQWEAVNVLWRQTPITTRPATSRSLHVVVPNIYEYDPADTPPPDEETEWDPWRKVEGPWTFDIELTVDGVAAVATPRVTNEIEGVPVTLQEVVVGPSAIRIQMDVNDPRDATWAFVGQVRRGDRTYPIVVSQIGHGIVTLQTDRGTDEASGDWSLVIASATRQGPGDSPEELITGPWTFDFSIP
jgi:hypothetical protein